MKKIMMSIVLVFIISISFGKNISFDNLPKDVKVTLIHKYGKKAKNVLIKSESVDGEISYFTYFKTKMYNEKGVVIGNEDFKTIERKERVKKSGTIGGFIFVTTLCSYVLYSIIAGIK